MTQHRIYRVLLSLIILLSGFGLLPVLAKEGYDLKAQTAQIAISADGTAVNYYEHGKEGAVLVFVHGWSCDASYWREQIGYFKEKYHMVLIDLAGHGRSGSERENYTMEAFGQDVLAVVENIRAEKVILIGHSMGALVIAYAARLMPEKVIGLIAVDDLQNVEYPLGEEQFKEMTTPFKEDFKQGVRGFVTGMLCSDKSKVNEWVINDMSLADPRVALNAMNGALGGYMTGDVSRLFDGLNVRVVAVNSNLSPTDIEANRRHIKDFELIVLAGLDHFMMLKAPERFNPALDQAVKLILLN